jgi:uncharacterized peroxidase-related enzyme
MPRMPQLTMDHDNPVVAGLLATTERQLGRVPNLYRTMANAPAALGGYLALQDELQTGVLTPADREHIALLVAQLNSCGYCVNAHSLRGARLLHMGPDELLAARAADSEDPRTRALLRFVDRALRTNGQVEEADVRAAEVAGLQNAELVEAMAHIALNVLSNYISHLAQPDLDFPAIALRLSP